MQGAENILPGPIRTEWEVLLRKPKLIEILPEVPSYFIASLIFTHFFRSHHDCSLLSAVSLVGAFNLTGGIPALQLLHD